jgi:hypothetical protein
MSRALKVVFDLQAAGEKLNFKDEPRRSLATLLKVTCEHSLDRLGAKGRRLATLRRLSHADRLDVLQTTAAYRTWSLFDVLLAETKALARRGTPETEEIGRLAFALIELLDRQGFPEPLKMDFRAEIWNEVGNGRRLRQDWRGASSALKTAAEHLREGTGDPLPVARRFSIQSSLAIDTGHIDAALKSAALARGIYEAEGDRGSALRAMIQEADPLVEIDPARALAMVEAALGTADETDSWLLMALRSTEILCLIELVPQLSVTAQPHELVAPQVTQQRYPSVEGPSCPLHMWSADVFCCGVSSEGFSGRTMSSTRNSRFCGTLRKVPEVPGATSISSRNVMTSPAPLGCLVIS